MADANVPTSPHRGTTVVPRVYDPNEAEFSTKLIKLALVKQVLSTLLSEEAYFNYSLPEQYQ